MAVDQHVEDKRLSCFERLGMECACCRFDDPRFFSIGHHNNDGAEHRRGLEAEGITIYDWVLTHPDPHSMVRTECYNCNFGAAYNGGKCPAAPHTYPGKAGPPSTTPGVPFKVLNRARQTSAKMDRHAMKEMRFECLRTLLEKVEEYDGYSYPIISVIEAKSRPSGTEGLRFDRVGEACARYQRVEGVWWDVATTPPRAISEEEAKVEICTSVAPLFGYEWEAISISRAERQRANEVGKAIEIAIREQTRKEAAEKELRERQAIYEMRREAAILGGLASKVRMPYRAAVVKLMGDSAPAGFRLEAALEEWAEKTGLNFTEKAYVVESGPDFIEVVDHGIFLRLEAPQEAI